MNADNVAMPAFTLCTQLLQQLNSIYPAQRAHISSKFAAAGLLLWAPAGTMDGHPTIL